MIRAVAERDGERAAERSRICILCAYIIEVIGESSSPANIPSNSVMFIDGEIKSDFSRDRHGHFGVRMIFGHKWTECNPFTVVIRFRIVIQCTHSKTDIRTEIILVAIGMPKVIYLVK